MIHRILFFVLIVSSLFGCLEVGERFDSVPPGQWRAILRLTPSTVTPNPKGKQLPDKVNLKFDEVTLGELPFNMEVSYVDQKRLKVAIINGEERIETTDIRTWHDKKSNRDSIQINFAEYESYLKAAYRGDIMEGNFVITSKKDYNIQFVAKFGQNHRFSQLTKPPTTDISGRWATTFSDEDGDTPAIGEFKQSGNKLSGTFLTETGDYRYLAGEVQANKLYLSCFDGSHAFLFEGKIDSVSGQIVGSFRSGKTYVATWVAKRDDITQLADPNLLTKATGKPVNFAFPSPEGQIITLDDPSLKGKVKILQIMGTWCPNCHDETRFLATYLSAHKDLPINAIALAFERHSDPTRAALTLRTYRDKMGITYPIVHAGMANKDSAALKLPFLDKIMSFPTTVFLDKQNRVRRVHTGFSGPATSEYTRFTTEFDQFVRLLAAEESSF